MAKDKTRIAIITAVWLRPDIYTIFRKITKNLISQLDDSLEVQVFVAGSEGDRSRIPTCQDEFEYIEVPNQPLSRKWNAVVKLAKEWNPDFCIFMGSDDVMDKDLFMEYVERMKGKSEPHYLGVYDWYFYDLESNQALYWGGYNKPENKGHFCGAGRVMNKSLLDKLDWEPWAECGLDHLLDTAMDVKLKDIKYTTEGFNVADYGIGLDIKSKTNMTKFAVWPNSTIIKPEPILEKIPLLKNYVALY
jgi:hypothetical protein